MKNINTYILTVIVASAMGMSSCGSKTEEVKKESAPALQSFEMNGTDTINRVDSKGLKQGIWMFFADKKKKDKNSAPPKLLVKGNYVNDKREGQWYYFSIDGTPSDTVNYQNDIPQE